MFSCVCVCAWGGDGLGSARQTCAPRAHAPNPPLPCRQTFMQASNPLPTTANQCPKAPAHITILLRRESCTHTRYPVPSHPVNLCAGMPNSLLHPPIPIPPEELYTYGLQMKYQKPHSAIKSLFDGCLRWHRTHAQFGTPITYLDSRIPSQIC